jgi:hypothetical protein
VYDAEHSLQGYRVIVVGRTRSLYWLPSMGGGSSGTGGMCSCSDQVWTSKFSLLEKVSIHWIQFHWNVVGSGDLCFKV